MRSSSLVVFLALLIALLPGCGGGNSGSATRTVTISVRWPDASARKAGRADVTAVNFITVEAYDGTVQIARTHIVKSGTLTATTTSLTLPAKDLTFYANGYQTNADPNYQTDPASGQPAHGTSNSPPYTPLAIGDLHPLSQAVTTVNIGTTPVLTFTMNNTIASISPVVDGTANPPVAKTTFPLDQGQINLFATIQAKSADGAVLMVDPHDYTWTYDPTDTHASKYVALVTQDPTTGLSMMTPEATGTARLIVTDTQTSPRPNITETITYTITNPSNKQTITLNTQAGSNVRKNVPSYAKSLTLTLSYDPLVIGEDRQPPPVTSAPFVVSPVYNSANTAITGVTLPTSSISFTPTGRTVTLKVQAWSQADGNGALLTEWIASGNSPVTATIDPSLSASHVNSFVLTPASPTITLTTSSNATGPGVNLLQLQVAASVGAGNALVPIDPRALSYTTNPSKVLTVATLATPIDALGNPFVLVTGTIQQTLTYPQTVTLTATDPVSNAKGSTPIKVQLFVPGFTFQ